MKLNLKKKVMLAVLAGNMLCMGQGFADIYVNGSVWHGDNSNPSQWKGINVSLAMYVTIADGCASGANLVTNGTETPDGVAFNAAKYFIAGYGTSGQITGNYLTAEDCNFHNMVHSVYAGYGDDGAAGVSGNFLTLEDCSLTSTSRFYGGYGASGVPVSGNTVWIKGENGDFDISSNYYIYGGYSNGANATGNVVIIENGTFGKPYIYGGYGSNAIDNTVEIAGGTFDTDGFFLYGGYSSSGTSSGNILNLKIKMTGRANSVSHFQIMNFTLPSDIEGGQTMLNTTSMTFDTTNKTTINVYAADGVKLNAGDVITLIDSTNVFVPENYIVGEILGGAAELVNKDDQNKILQIVLSRDFEQKKSGGSEDQQKAPVEGVAAAAAMVNASADLASGEGMSSLVANTAGGTDTFGAMSAGSSKYKTGSHVDVDGWGVIVGAGNTKKWDNGNATTYGLFFEYGKGDFDTYNGNVHGDGNSENKGVGIMIRHQLANNVYFEGNIRYGKQETEWSESELGGYETDSKYHGAMVGFGKIYKKGNNKLDTYLRYAYGHVGACDATLKDGTDYHFESVKSHRVRTGVRYTFGQRETGFKPYIGAAWEHEFDGEARASISGIGEAPAPSVKGNTGIFELGFDWDDDSKWVVGLGANAYIGKRKGWDGMARVFYNF